MRKITKKHLSVGSIEVAFVHKLQLVVKVFEIAPAYSRTVKSALVIVKKVNKSCRATERASTDSWKKGSKKLPNPMGFLISSHMSYA